MTPTSKWMELLFLEVEWRFATTMSTTQYVMRGGLTMMLKLSVVPTLATTLHLIVSTKVSIHFLLLVIQCSTKERITQDKSFEPKHYNMLCICHISQVLRRLEAQDLASQM